MPLANGPDPADAASEAEEHSGTVLEADEGLSLVLKPAIGGAEPPAQARQALAYRPTQRPSVAYMVILDDGRSEGEVVRVRGDRLVIGRTDGDVNIPHDGRISSRHAEITRQRVGGTARWVLTDLQSTNGLFVRVSRTALADRAEFLVGGGRYRFDDPRAPDPSATVDYAPGPLNPEATRGWADAASPIRPAALTELIGHEIGNRVLLVKPEYWIGADPACAIARPDDPFCEWRHARLQRSPRGRWSIQHNHTLNGLWLRVPQVVVDRSVQFQIGEQRFCLKV